jgi:hypothetical protein
MKTLNVEISELEYSKFGLKDDRISFSDFVELISKELIRSNLSRCIDMAAKYGLSSMTIEEISNEVNEVRNERKNRN